MRISRSLQLYSTLFLFLSVLTSAWPWPRFLPDIDSLIVRRQDGGSSSSGSGSERFVPGGFKFMLILFFFRLSPSIRNKYWFIGAYTDRKLCLELNNFCSVFTVWLGCQQQWQWQWQQFDYEQTNNYLSHLI